MVKTLTGETAYTFVSLDSLVVVELASSPHSFIVVEVSVYVREYGEDLLLLAIWNECVHCIKGAWSLWVEVFCHVGLCFSYRYARLWIHILGRLTAISRECEAADSEKDRHMTLSSVQNPIELATEG